MAVVIKAPGKYIQGAGELQNLGLHCKKLGERFFILCSENTRARIGEILEQSLADVEKEAVFFPFAGQCSKAEIARAQTTLLEANCDAVIGMGGGKAIDTAKAVADSGGLPLVVVPTIASNDAPCSGIAVIYNSEGMVVKALFTKRGPDVVLVDTSIIAAAPVRLFVAGIGDALATWFEARAVHASGARTMARGGCSNTALMMAKLCYDILLRDGAAAVADVRESAVSGAVENVVEATIFLSGIGFESGGLAAAHAVNDGLAHLPETHGMYHGEKVAFGTLVQLLLEDTPQQELDEVFRFAKTVGLPVTLAELGVALPDTDRLRKVSEAACAPTQSTKNLSRSVTATDILGAILKVDYIGKQL